MDVSTRGSLMWEEVRVPVEIPCAQVGEHLTLSHTTTVDHGDQTWVAVVRALSTALLGHPTKNPS